jgi:hypothetical protein
VFRRAHTQTQEKEVLREKRKEGRHHCTKNPSRLVAAKGQEQCARVHFCGKEKLIATDQLDRTAGTID